MTTTSGARTRVGRRSLAAALGCVALMTGASGVRAADVTYERLLNPEPHNWLMNHRDFGAQRHSPLDAINTSNVKNLKLAFAISIGGTSTNEYLQATPLVEDGFMYMVDSWGIVSKFDVRSGTSAKVVWRMDPKLEKQDRNRGVALWGNLVISIGGFEARVIATDKETGKVVWDRSFLDQADLEFTAAPLALKDSIIIGSSGGDRGLRAWVASLDARTGDLQWKTFAVPAPGEPGSETWKDKNNAWQTGGGAFYVTGSYDPASNLTYWGSGNPVPAYDAGHRPGDNLYTSSAIAFDAANGKIRWHHQYNPNDNHDYDETGTHIIIDSKVNGEDRKILSHAGRNGFQYIFDRLNGQFLKATQHVKQVTWTKGIDPKTGKPADYDPARDVQTYNEPANSIEDKVARNICPQISGGTNYWPASYSRRTNHLYIPANEGCSTITTDKAAHVKGNFWGGVTGGNMPLTSAVTMLDPATGELKKRVELPYPNYSGVLSTAGGIVVTALLDGTILAFDDQTLEELWRINVGSGFNAPPMTYSVNGNQYIAIVSGLCCAGAAPGQFRNARQRLSRIPELRTQGNATMVFVFGL
jgi:alcohol dehydrogenase (cytochrome c)